MHRLSVWGEVLQAIRASLALFDPCSFITLHTLFGFYHIPLKHIVLHFHQIAFECVALVFSAAHISSLLAAIKLVNQGCGLISTILYHSSLYYIVLFSVFRWSSVLYCITMVLSLFIRANSNADNLVVVAVGLTNSLTRPKVEGWSYWTESPPRCSNH